MDNRHMKRCSTSNHQGNASQNHSEISPYICHNDFSKKQTKSVGEDLEKREHLCSICGNINWCSHCGKQYGGSSKKKEIKSRTTIWYSNSTPGYIAKENEGLMLKLKLQHFGHLMRRANSLEKPLMLERLGVGGDGGDRGWGGWITSPTQWSWIWANSER